MVLYKRKPVQFLSNQDIEDHIEVWHIEQTGEIFDTYEEYLNRIDFYRQKKFICPITGHSGLTFFEALQSELTGAAEVEQAFPEALKGPVLRKVQFQTISRIDALVDTIYDEFKADYFPGENVTVSVLSGERLHGVVRDKSRFGSRPLPDGSLSAPFSRYFVSLDDRPEEEAVVDNNHIFRDRKVFTKSVLRSFIKKTVTREAWTGAPWLVKHDVAAQYHIDTRVPASLRYDTKLMERKQIQQQKKLQSDTEMNGSAAENGGQMQGGSFRLPELKPAPKSHKAKTQQSAQLQGKGKQNGHGPQEARQFVHMPVPGNPFQVSMRNAGPPPAFSQPVAPPPPPPIKYPIEDLQLEPRDRVRPALNYLANDLPAGVERQEKDSSPRVENLAMKSVGPLLETWDTLNVYCEVFQLDSFTFDDFVETLAIASDDQPVQLFDEMHCAVLKMLVKSESDGGNIAVRLPQLDTEEEEEEDEDEDEDEPEPEPEPKPTARATRGSLAKAEAERMAAEAAQAEKESQAEPVVIHRAEDALTDFDWIDSLRKRDFRNGGWQLIMVGLLHQLSKSDRHRASCEELLSKLCPPEFAATQESVRQQYLTMDINYRVQALQIICMLTTETKAIREYMEECSNTMTTYRKEKIEWQRQRKAAIEELKLLNDQRKLLLPETQPDSATAGATAGTAAGTPAATASPTAIKVNGDIKMSDAEDVSVPSHDEVADSDDDEPVHRNRGRGLRRADDRAVQRKRKRDDEQERKKEAEAAKLPKQSKQLIKVLKDIEKKEELIKKCENEVAIIDNDLREADCPRTRVLGKDRFWNRYYWFERNGMPYGGLPNSSTASAQYANGCIWVQGPDEIERLGYIDMIPEYQNEYKAKFNITVPERKNREEGPTHVFNATEWGYISRPEDVKALIDWLDPRGFNELKLRKELVNYRDKITTNMENRIQYLGLEPKPSTNGDEQHEAEEEKKKDKRTSARTRPTPEPPQPRCLQWTNLYAIQELDHLHSEQPAPVRSRKQTARKKETTETVTVEPPKKRPSRQGTRYNF